MIQEYRNIIGVPILHHTEGALLGLLKDLIINPDTGKIEAIWIKPATIPTSHAIIQIQDIIEWKKNIYIKDDSVIAEPSDVIKISDILMRKTEIISNRVQNESGAYFGKVDNIDFDTNYLYLRNLYVRKSFLGFVYQKCIFHYDNIIEVLPNYILVNDRGVKKKKAIKSGLLDDKQVLLDN